jgi:small-conductance mechanosensitive channel
MIDLLSAGVADWIAIVALVLVLPTMIIVAGEAQERLRVRGSMLEKPVAIVRNWLLPLAAAWALGVVVIGMDQDGLLARVVASAFLIVLTIAILQLLRFFVDGKRGESKIPGTAHVPELLMMVPRLVIILVALWFFFTEVWNVDLSGLFAALGVTSLIVSLALQDTLSGLASGFLILGDRPFNPGDWIQFGDIEGRVVDTNWRSSRIRDRNGDLVVVPNSTLSSATIVNYDEPEQLHRVVVSLQVAYSNPPSSAIAMLLAAARATEGVVEDPPPQVRVVQIDDPLMGYDVQMWITDYTVAPRVKSEFGALVWYQSHRMDVPLPSPAYDLFHHDPIQEAIDGAPTIDELMDRIRRAPVLSGLSEGDLRQLAEAARPDRFQRGEIILGSGVVNRDVFVLWHGRAQIVAADRPDTFISLSDGDVFGVVGRSSRNQVPPGILALTDCEIVRIHAEAAGAVASRNTELTDQLDQLMISRARRLSPLVDDNQFAAPEALGFLGDAAGAPGDGDKDSDNVDREAGAPT